jgi:hypothetical protein
MIVMQLFKSMAKYGDITRFSFLNRDCVPSISQLLSRDCIISE